MRHRIIPPVLFTLCMILIAQYGGIVLFFCAILAVYFFQSEIRRSYRDTREAIDRSETSFNFGGVNFRVFLDYNEECWFRASEFKKHLTYNKSDRDLQQLFPLGFAKVNSQIDVWYIHVDSIRQLFGKSTRQPVCRFLAWIENEVEGKHRFRSRDSTDVRHVVIPARPNRPAGLMRFISNVQKIWRGESTIFESFLGGAVCFTALVVILALFNSTAPWVDHFQIGSFCLIMNLVLISFSLYIWGRALLLSSERWLASGRSVIAATVINVVGMCIVFLGLYPFVDLQSQYSLSDYLKILIDHDNKATVTYNKNTKYLNLSGEFGYGTTNNLRIALKENPGASGIELKSYGGRVEEGFAVSKIIEENHLVTYVHDECMSACVYAYIAGSERYVAPSAKFGLHRSGQHWIEDDGQLNASDNKFVELMRNKHVNEGFIKASMVPSIHGIYAPTPGEVVSSGLATSLFDPHDIIYRTADDVSAQITTVLAQMVARIKSTQATKIPGSIIRDESIALVADYRIEQDGQCSVLINSNYVRNSGNEELGAVFAMQYAHCLYRDEHSGISEHDAWKQAYRADGFAAKLFTSEGVKASCINEHDSETTPSCERRLAALQGGNETFREN